MPLDTGQGHARQGGDLALADLLDRALNKGVVLWGEAVVSLAGVDLVYAGLKVLVASTDAVERMRAGAGREAPFGGNGKGCAAAGESETTTANDLDAAVSGTAPAGSCRSAPAPDASRLATEPETAADDLVKLVLALVETVRQLLEKQAIRRVEGGALPDEEVERLGLALLALERRMAELKSHFGIGDQDLSLKFGSVADLEDILHRGNGESG